MTLGNALQRVLLSSLPGAAVTAIRREGVQHEHQRINHVLEDVSELILNVKQIRLRSFSDQVVSVHLDVSGMREVTAADITASPLLEIVNPECHLATLTHETAHLMMEFMVKTGRGYIPADPKKERSEAIIPIDAIYTPVQRVKMVVEQARVGQMTNFEKIVLTITTDGTITPDEALKQSAEILVRHFLVFADDGTGRPASEKTPLSGIPIPWEIYRMPLEELGLSIRAYNGLKRNNIITIGQVLSMSDEDLLSIRNLGDKGLKQLAERLRAHNVLPVALPDESLRRT
jgi:DNA-directed RNA polymerase subunit alpha